jgi:nucleoside-triphosphatase
LPESIVRRQSCRVNLLLTGRPGVGKTTAVQAATGLLGDRGARLGGFVTEELRVDGQRVGFALVSLDGERRTMAHADLVSRQRVGRYGVDVEVIDYVVDVTLHPELPVKGWIVDEIGKMECFSRRFVSAIERLLADPRPLVATIARRGPGLIEQIKSRPDIELWEVDEANRDALPERLVSWLDAQLEG